MQTTRRGRHNGEQALLSHSTILILSGYLIGAGSVTGSAPGVGETALAAGLCGLIGYISMRIAAGRRARRQAEAAVSRAARTLEVRLHRHIPRPALLGRRRLRRRERVSPAQYLAVVRRS